MVWVSRSLAALQDSRSQCSPVKFGRVQAQPRPHNRKPYKIGRSSRTKSAKTPSPNENVSCFTGSAWQVQRAVSRRKPRGSHKDGNDCPATWNPRYNGTFCQQQQIRVIVMRRWRHDQAFDGEWRNKSGRLSRMEHLVAWSKVNLKAWLQTSHGPCAAEVQIRHFR